jgi:hypothetical protein
MSVKNITGISKWDVYKRQVLLRHKIAKPAPTENELLETPKDASFDAFNDVNDEMLGMVYNVVSQYQKMGGKLKLTGSGLSELSGGRLGDDDEYQIDLKQSNVDLIARLEAYQKKYRGEPINSVLFWETRYGYYKKIQSGVDPKRKAIKSKIDQLVITLYQNLETAQKKEAKKDAAKKTASPAAAASEPELTEAEQKAKAIDTFDFDDPDIEREFTALIIQMNATKGYEEEELKRHRDFFGKLRKKGMSKSPSVNPSVLNKIDDVIETIDGKLKEISKPPPVPPPVPPPPPQKEMSEAEAKAREAMAAARGKPHKSVADAKATKAESAADKAIAEAEAAAAEAISKAQSAISAIADEKQKANEEAKAAEAEARVKVKKALKLEQEAQELRAIAAKAVHQQGTEDYNQKEKAKADAIAQAVKSSSERMEQGPKPAPPGAMAAAAGPAAAFDGDEPNINDLEFDFSENADKVNQLLARWISDYEKLNRPIGYWVAKEASVGQLITDEENGKNRATVKKNMNLLMKLFQDKQRDLQLVSSGNEAKEARAQADMAKDLISGNTSLPGLLGTITNLSNKMYRLVKLKRIEWKSSIPSKDLRDVHEKVVEYVNKMKQIDASDKVMSGYEDMHKLSIQRMTQLSEEFNVLVRTSNFNNSVNVPITTGGRRQINKSRTVFIGEGQPVNVMSFFRKN